MIAQMQDMEPHVTDATVSRTSADDRHRHIVSIVRERGYVTNEELAKTFGVTVQTVRRDVNKLADDGEIRRHHGGAGLASSIQNIDYVERQGLSTPEKEAIAALTAGQIPNHSSLFINIGTTTAALARALTAHEDLRVITNDLNIALTLSRNTSFTVMVTGGTVRNRDGGIVGQSTCDMIGEFRVDYGIIGISGIDEQGTLLDFDYDEVRAARAIISNSRQTFLLADHTKFIRHPMVRMGSLTEVSALFTDRPPRPAILQLLLASGVALHVVGDDGA
jgi:DeoR family transcriptional regulator, glycerol-3-phosphate regulon repressor